MLEQNNNEPVEKLLQLQQIFKRKLPKKILDIESSWKDFRSNKSTDLNELHLKIHSLIGSAGTFGASGVSVAARNLESPLKLLLNNKLMLNDDVIEQIEYLVTQLHNISNKWQPSSIPFIPEKNKVIKEENSDWVSNIYLVEDDVKFAKPLIEYLEKSGYSVFYYEDIKEFEQSYIKHERASAILMDMAFEDGITAGAETIQYLSEQDDHFPPVIFISVHDDIQARLAAAQAGARRYFVKPIDQPKLIRTLDKLTHRTKFEPYRILLVDDDKDVLDFYSASLKESGMNILSFTNPMDAYQSIDNFKPEIIILDLYMPECSGFDLAKVIRQDDEQASIPIVFLSSELDMGTQLAAMDLGGDDFLMKPVDIEYFVHAITVRAKRFRYINKLNMNVKNALRESEYRLVTLDQHAIISMTDTAGAIIFANIHFEKISGYSEDELLGSNHNILKSGKHSASFYDDMWVTISSGKIWRGQICNRAKTGNEYWVESTIVPFMDENGQPYKYVSVKTDITKVKQSEKDAQESEKRLLEQQKTLNTLSKLTDNLLHEEDEFFQIATIRSAEILNVKRVSIWMLDKNRIELICKQLYDTSNNDWSEGLRINIGKYPDCFPVLENNIVISSSDVHTDPIITELIKNNHISSDIGAIMIIPIRRLGRLIGIVCCEHTGGSRIWRADEQGFITALADLISLNIESNERKIAEKNLVEAKKDAENANKAKSEFLSSMSHELRTPMNAISGFAQLLKMDSANKLDDMQKNNVEEILNASNHLLQLVNEILNLAKIESGNIDLSFETVSYSDVVVESFSLLGKLIQDRNIQVFNQFNDKSISMDDVVALDVNLYVDRIRFKQVLLNLLSNAVKYNVKKGSIIVACNVVNDVVRISITDTGKGISINSQSELFKSFNRLGQENGSIEGTGIGLVITKRLVNKMGGKIGVVSEIDKGSTFWVEFPLAKNSENKNINSGSLIKYLSTDEKLEKEHSVLYIEDNPANLRLVGQILSSKNNIKMISAHEPNLGLQLAFSKAPDLILLDINLPGMSGFEVLKKLRENDKTKHTQIFAVSANAMLRDIEAGMTAGFDDYITKPIDVASFVISVMKVLNKL